MDRNRGKTSEYEQAYKKKSTTIDKRALRLHRRSIEWKNNRGDRLNSARNLESLSPLQEITHNSLNDVDDGYEGKTPKKMSHSHEESQNDLSKENKNNTLLKTRLEKLAKWREEKELKKKLQAQERAKNRPFKVTKVDHTELEKFNAKVFGQAKQMKVEPAKTNISNNKSSMNTRQAAQKNTTKKTSVTMKSAKNSGASSHTKTFPKPTQPAPQAKSKGHQNKVKSTKGQSEVNTVKGKKKHIQVDLQKVSTSRGESFAPEEFTFNAPSNLSSFVFRPLSPNTAASFLGQDAGASFIGTDPKRCSTPKRSSNIKKALRQEQQSEEPFKVENDVTISANDTVQQPLRRSSRQKDLRKSETSQHASPSIKEAENPEKVAEFSGTRTRSMGRSEDRSRRSSQGKRTLDRSSNRRLSHGGNKQDRSVSRSRTRSSKADNTPARSSSTKRARGVSDDNQSDGERAMKRSKSVHVDIDVLQNKSVIDLKEEKATPKRRSLRLSRKSVIEVDKVDSKSEVTDTDDVFEKADENDKKKDEFVEIKDITTLPHEESLKSDLVEIKDTTTPSCTTQTVRRSLQSKPAELGDNTPCNSSVEKSSEPMSVDQREENEENIPARKITRSTKRRSLSSLEGFAKPDSDSVVLSAKRTATKKKRRKTVYDHTIVKSPEEWIKLLQNSPMIEMNRRKPKQKTSPAPPTLDLDLDLDEMEGSDPSKILNFSNCNIDNVSSMEQIQTEIEANKEQEQNQAQNYVAQELQVDEISTTQCSDKSDDSSKPEEHNVAYFRNLLQTETDRLNQLCKKWDDVNDSNPDLSEEVKGQLRTVVGQGQLLVDQRFKQFRGLVDNCEFNLGEKETTCTDLEGFWEMIYFQVEDVNAKFLDLVKLQSNNWDLTVIQPKKKVLKKKVVSKPVTKKPVIKSKFAAFRAGMKNKQVAVTEEITFDAGFFKVQSPVKTPSIHCEAGSPKHSVTCEEETHKKEESKTEENKAQLDPSDLLPTSFRTPLKRKSYAPNVPSPLLQDITPQPRPTRNSTFKKTPLPKNILSDVDDNVIMDTNLTSIAQDLVKTLSEKKLVNTEDKISSEKKYRRRSTRTRKSVSFCDNMSVPHVQEEKNEDPFSKYLQPMTPRMSMAPKGYSVLDAIPANDSFTTQAEANVEVTFSPVTKGDTMHSPLNSSKRRLSGGLKQLPTRERRKSSRKSVLFSSPKTEIINDQEPSDVLMTPPSRHVPSNTSTPDSSDGELNKFSNLNIGYTPVARSTRASLLFTPPIAESVSVITDIPTGQLISFTP